MYVMVATGFVPFLPHAEVSVMAWIKGEMQSCLDHLVKSFSPCFLYHEINQKGFEKLLN